MASAGARPGGQSRRRAHELHFTISQARRTTLGVVLLTGFIAPVLAAEVGWPRYFAWAGLTVIAYCIRALVLRPGTDIAVVERNPDRWAVALFGSTLVSGLIGASAPILFFSVLPAAEQMFLTMILCCWAAGAMAAIGASRLLYSSYLFVFILPLIAAWLMTDDPRRFSVAALLVAYGVVIASFANSFARQVAEGFEIRFQNEELVAQLEAARRTAEDANRAKSRLLAVASHDLRQPLHVLTILSGLLGRYATSERLAEIAHQIIRSVNSLEKLFSSLLDISRLDVGAVKPDPQPVLLRSLAAQLQYECQPMAQAQGLAFEMHGCDVAIVTDHVLLERILRNLIENAIKYTTHGKVTLAWEHGTDDVVVRVTDTGPGIRPEDREAVFAEFYQARAGLDHRERGLGLGLAIVRRLSDLLGYRIEFQSTLGHGTTFELTVPGRYVTAAAGGPGAAPEVGPKIDLDGFAIVYIDDDVHVHDAMRLLLEDWGCEVVTVATLEEARTRMRALGMRPQAILTDYALKGNVTGIEVIEALRKEYGALPAAIITGETAPESRAELGESEYPVLFKPAQSGELRNLLEVFRSIG